MEKFAERLTDARKAKGLTQDALAKAAAVTRQTISSWERGRTVPDIDTIHRLSDILGVDLIQQQEQESAPSAVESATEAGDQTEPVAADGAKPSRRIHRRWIWAGIAAVACIALVFCLLSPRKPASAGAQDVFDIETYQRQTPNEAGKAYITFENKTWEEKGENDTYQRYDFTMYEHNGIGFSISRLDIQCEGKSGHIRSKSYGVNDFRALGQATEIAPFGSLVIDGGFPKGEFTRVGIAVYGNDANGAALTFYNLIEL